MAGVEEVADVGVHPVGGQGVLGQVVGADGEEVHLLGQHVGHDGGGGGLDHDAVLHVLAVGHALLVQLLAHLGQDGFNLQHLLQVGDHGEHDVQLAVYRRAQQRPQLGAEDIRLLEADADGPVAHGGVLLPLDAEVGGLLVAAQIQGTHHHRPGSQPGQHLLIDLKLSLLGGEIGAVQVDELAAEQPNAAAPPGNHRVDVPQTADVGAHQNLVAALGHRLAVLIRLQRGLVGQKRLPAPGEVRPGGLVGMGEHLAGGAVDGHKAGLGQLGVVVPHAHDAGDAQGTGQDDGVGGGRAQLGDKARHPVFIQPDGLAGQQVLRRHNHRLLGELGGIRDALEHPDQPVAHVRDIGGAGLHILVLHGLEHGGQAVGGLPHGVFGVKALVQQPVDAVDEVGVLQHHAVDIKHLGHVLVGGPGLFVQAVQLPDGLGGGLLIALVLLDRVQSGLLGNG